MIDVYSWPTPNGHKIHIMLLECGLQLGHDWQVHPIDIGQGEQFTPDFLRISPNNKIPALVDHNGPNGQPLSLFESGAILLYLAEKTGQFMPQDTHQRWNVMQWLMFQVGGLGPMLGQAHHFRIYAPDRIEYAVARYTNEAKRLYGVLNTQLQDDRDFIVGSDYSIADMAIYPWLRSWENQGIQWEDHPHLHRWFERVGQRPAVQQGVQVLASARRPLTDDKARQVLFGAQAKI